MRKSAFSYSWKISIEDFNLNERTENNLLFEELLNVALWVPEPIQDVKSTYSTEAKRCDQIAWFMGDLIMIGGEVAGVVDFS